MNKRRRHRDWIILESWAASRCLTKHEVSPTEIPEFEHRFSSNKIPCFFIYKKRQVSIEKIQKKVSDYFD